MNNLDNLTIIAANLATQRAREWKARALAAEADAKAARAEVVMLREWIETQRSKP